MYIIELYIIYKYMLHFIVQSRPFFFQRDEQFGTRNQKPQDCQMVILRQEYTDFLCPKTYVTDLLKRWCNYVVTSTVNNF